MKNPISLEELGQPFKALVQVDIYYRKYLIRVLHLAAASALFYGIFGLAWPVAVLIAAVAALPPYPYSPFPGAVLGSIGAAMVWKWPAVLAILACFSWIIVFIVCQMLFMYFINIGRGK